MGSFSEEEIEKIKKYVINPVEAREAALSLPETLAMAYEVPQSVETVEGFTHYSDAQLADFIAERGLAMDLADSQCCRAYFAEEQRDPDDYRNQDDRYLLVRSLQTYDLQYNS